ncbi:MAG: hypothetical protein CMN50_03250 [SAR116 cluster bacterium]|nr:hypothetical protein [SAR116 cluster bacterium]
MNLIEVKTFLSVIKENGITAAAKSLNVTQPAVTKRLENLKNYFGISELFKRNSGNFSVSDEAKILIPYAKNLVALAETAKNEIGDQISGKKGKVFIGSGSSWTLSNLPSALSKTLESFPNLSIDVNVDSPDTLLKKLTDNEIDILFARRPENLEHFDYINLRTDKFIILASSKHPLRGKNINLNDLSNYKWCIATTASQTKSLFDNWFSSRNLKKPEISLSTNSLRMGLNSLKNSSSLLFTTLKATETISDKSIEILDIKDFDIYRDTGVITRKGYNSSFFQTLLENIT